MKRSVGGFSLVELLVAVTLSLVLLAGVVQIYANSKQSYRLQEALARMQENGRFAIEKLRQDIRMAGYWACVHSPRENGFVTAVAGSDGVTDALVVGQAVDSPVSLSADAVLGSGPLRVSGTHGFADGDYLLVSDCNNGDVVRIQGSPSSTSLPVVTGGSTSSYAAADSAVYPVRQVRYHVYNTSLMRNGQPLVDGVEDLQILYGTDLRNDDRTADQYLSGRAVSTGGWWSQVVNVRVVLALRSSESLAVDTADGHIRQVYTTTIGLGNRQGAQ